MVVLLPLLLVLLLLFNPLPTQTLYVYVSASTTTAAAAAANDSSSSTIEDEHTPTHPNIVLLLADNLGYEDVSWFASQKHNRTMYLDTLGADGMTFFNWNSAAHLCSASRAALLTGQYPIRNGVFPGVFHPDAMYGLRKNSTTLAMYLKQLGYRTSIVGKWHLGHRKDYLPTQFGFDEWFGIPFHMSGGSLDNHTCVFDDHHLQWLPLYENDRIVEQPVQTKTLAQRYMTRAKRIVRNHSVNNFTTPFFLFLSFSHVHQLCASADHRPEQSTCQWASHTSSSSNSASFADAVTEMDQIAGGVLKELQSHPTVYNNTLVIFTSDNGPWLAEQSCSGLRGPFAGQWLREFVPQSCTACPHDYISSPTLDRPRRCLLKVSNDISQDQCTSPSMDGVHCGDDSGLGSVWEANLRMPTMIRWPGRIVPGSNTTALVSSLDLVPTILSIVNYQNSNNNDDDDGVAAIAEPMDGHDISAILFGEEEKYDSSNRTLFFWRDGFLLNEAPLGPPYGRFDVVAVKVGRIKAWFWTKSAHYNNDLEAYHDPPLLFDTLMDPGESVPIQYPHHDELDPYTQLVQRIRAMVVEHKASVGEAAPLALARDPRYIPCFDPQTGCRTPKSNCDPALKW